MIRATAQREAWKRLDPWRRHLLTSHHPDDMERDAGLRHSIMTALENVFGAREYGPSAARVEDGDSDGDSGGKGPKGEELAMTLEEIGAVLGCDREHVRQIERSALRKLRRNAGWNGLYQLWHDGPPPVTGDIDLAIARAADLSGSEAGK